MPFAVVVDELIDVGVLVELAEQEVVEDGIVEHDGAGVAERSPVDIGVEGVVAELIEGGVAVVGRDFDGAVAAEFGEQGGGVIGDAAAGGRERRVESDGHGWVDGFWRFPKSAVPTRTQVEPSSMAVSRSWDMPMERPRSSCFSASSRRRRK